VLGGLPGARVTLVDVDTEMLDEARGRLAPFAERARFLLRHRSSSIARLNARVEDASAHEKRRDQFAAPRPSAQFARRERQALPRKRPNCGERSAPYQLLLIADSDNETTLGIAIAVVRSDSEPARRRDYRLARVA
jgi:hypothetical protein